jgi:NADH:ubiquinone oxidoreductase subunit 5 (subunit L)/multisubunit Na+/H+ antiporter MnhA subunit
VIAILTSALTLASFIKFFGVSFLSRSSAVTARAAAQGRLEVGWLMQLPQVFLAALCVLLGLVPAIAFRLVQLTLEASPNGLGAALGGATGEMNPSWTGLQAVHSQAVFAPLALLAVLAVTFLTARFLSRLGGAPRRAAIPWLCGYARDARQHRYVAHNFYGEIKRYFRWIGGGPSRWRTQLRKR